MAKPRIEPISPPAHAGDRAEDLSALPRPDLGYFPGPLPDELLYSLLARYGFYNGLSYTRVCFRLFGQRRVQSTYDLPGSLRALARRLPLNLNLGAERICRDMTLLPYWTALRENQVRRQAEEGLMSDRSGWVRDLVRAAGHLVPRPVRLRFCTICNEQMIDDYGEAYWRRDHQLLSSIVCPDHGCALLESQAHVGLAGREVYVAAGEKAFASAAPVFEVPDANTRELLLEIARRGGQMLLSPPEAVGLGEHAARYRRNLRCAGITATGGLDLREIKRLLVDRWDHALKAWPNLDLSRMSDFWLKRILRGPRGSIAAPVCHILMQGVIEELELGPIPQPAFDPPPWACRNPVQLRPTGHNDVELTITKYHYGYTGEYACRCGYTYRRRLSHDGQLGPPVVFDIGDEFEAWIVRQLAAGASLRQISEQTRHGRMTLIVQMKARGHIIGRLPPSMANRKARTAPKGASRLNK